MPNDELLLELDGMLRKVDWFQYKWLSFDKKDRHYLIREILAKLKAMGWKSPEEYRAILSILIHEVQHTKGDELNKLLDSWVTANNLHPELVETVGDKAVLEILTGGESMSEQKRRCSRCGNIRTDTVDSDICGNCADDLRSEREVEAEDYHQQQLRESNE